MYPKLIKSAFLILVVVVLICCIYVSFPNKNDARIQATQDVLANDQSLDEQNDSERRDDVVRQAESTEYKHMKCLQTLAETTVDMLIASRNVIAKNQELINRDPTTGNYSFKGFVPAVAGSQVANDFSLMSGHRLKQTSLKVRNPTNVPDEWERKALKLLGSPGHPKGAGIGEIQRINGNKIYRYIKPIFAEKPCLQCHGKKEGLRPAIKQFLEMRYPYDQAFGYKEGDIRGGISLIISLERLNLEK